MNRPPAARAAGLVKTYGRGAAAVHALDGVSLEVPAAAFTAIMGPSGSGKSTLMHLLAGLDTATAGQAFLGDTDLGACAHRELTAIRRDRIGFVFQSFNLLPQLTAAQNIDLPTQLAGRRVDPAWRETLVGLLDLTDRLGHRPAQLSGGQQQRVALARAMLGRPEVVFADEPTGNLDSAGGHEVLGLLQPSVRALGGTGRHGDARPGGRLLRRRRAVAARRPARRHAGGAPPGHGAGGARRAVRGGGAVNAAGVLLAETRRRPGRVRLTGLAIIVATAAARPASR